MMRMRVVNGGEVGHVIYLWEVTTIAPIPPIWGYIPRGDAIHSNSQIAIFEGGGDGGKR